MRPARRLLIVLAVASVILVLFRATMVSSQSSNQLQLDFSNALSAVRGAEAAGAMPREIAPLVSLLNSALQLSAEPNSGSQVASQLSTVQTQAAQLQTVASQRTLTNHLIAYVAGGIGALLVTIASIYLLSFWRRYRVRRTFQMRIRRK